MNADRAANGLAPVAYDSSLLAVARQRAADQIPLPVLSHYDATRQVVVAPLVAAAQTNYRLVGENLARLPGGDATVVARAEEALMRSPGGGSDRRLLPGALALLVVSGTAFHLSIP